MSRRQTVFSTPNLSAEVEENALSKRAVPSQVTKLPGYSCKLKPLGGSPTILWAQNGPGFTVKVTHPGYLLCVSLTRTVSHPVKVT